MTSEQEEQVIQAALEAGRAIMSYHRTETLRIELKPDESPVTAADFHAHRIIDHALEKLPYPVISEEGIIPPYSSRKNWEFFWLVDPLDGTKEFIQGRKEFTVNIALVRQGRPVFGVIYVPAFELLYVGNTLRQKAYKSTVLGSTIKGTVLLPPSTGIQWNAPRVMTSRSHPDDLTKKVLSHWKRHFPQTELIPVGSSLKFCYLAEGKADLFLRNGPTMEWDTAAGQAICEAAGWTIRQNRAFDRMMYNKVNLRNDGFSVVPDASLKDPGLKEHLDLLIEGELGMT